MPAPSSPFTKSIFNIDNNAELIARINTITRDTPAVWGKMNAAQMMAHCQITMNIAFGNSKNIRHWIGIVFGAVAKHRLLKVKELDRNIPTFKQAIVNDERSFDEEKEKFIALIEAALQRGPSVLRKHPHPYLGRLKPHEWAQLNWLHLDHHLRQFAA